MISKKNVYLKNNITGIVTRCLIDFESKCGEYRLKVKIPTSTGYLLVGFNSCGDSLSREYSLVNI